MLPIIPSLNENERRLVGESWAHRAESEARIALRYTAMAQALMVHGATKTVLDLCQRAMADEERHLHLCTKVALEFGVKPEMENIQRPGPLAPIDLPVDRKVLYEVVALCCVGETINGSLLGHIYQQSKWPSIRLTAHTLLEDEIWHSRTGWAHLGAMHKKADITWLSPHILSMLQRVHDHGFLDDQGPWREAAHMKAYGELDYRTRIRLFRQTVTQVILPGFESFHLNIDEARSWINGLAR